MSFPSSIRYDGESVVSSDTLTYPKSTKASHKHKDYETAGATLISRYGFSGNAPVLPALSSTSDCPKGVKNPLADSYINKATIRKATPLSSTKQLVKAAKASALNSVIKLVGKTPPSRS